MTHLARAIRHCFGKSVQITWLIALFAGLLVASNIAAAEAVNINKAAISALQEHLAGIGAAKSTAIVDYRNNNGAF